MECFLFRPFLFDSLNTIGCYWLDIALLNERRAVKRKKTRIPIPSAIMDSIISAHAWKNIRDNFPPRDENYIDGRNTSAIVTRLIISFTRASWKIITVPSRVWHRAMKFQLYRVKCVLMFHHQFHHFKIIHFISTLISRKQKEREYATYTRNWQHSRLFLILKEINYRNMSVKAS